jgi:flagellar motor switch protein FliG
MVAPARGGFANIFYPLSPRLTVLLATIFLHGGEEDLYVGDYLSDEDAYLLKERAQALLQIDGAKRAGIVAAEVKRQFGARALLGLDQIDPSWLLAALRGEQPITIGIILAQLSASTRARILSQLPQPVQARVPGKDDLKNTQFLVMRVVRQIFDSKFATMPVPPGEPTNFYFKDIVLLDGRELVQLIRALGLEQLGTAFAAIGRRKLGELCTRLGQDAAEELVTQVKQTEARDAMDVNEANAFLQRILLNLKLDEARGISVEEAKERFQRELFQRSGLFRLAVAIRAERPGFIQQLAQRLPRTHGRALRGFVDKMDEVVPYDDAKVRRLQDLILLRVEKLAARGKVNPRYLKFTFCYWGDEQVPPEGGDPNAQQ